jgi:hypothetical protein
MVSITLFLGAGAGWAVAVAALAGVGSLLCAGSSRAVAVASALAGLTGDREVGRLAGSLLGTGACGAVTVAALATVLTGYGEERLVGAFLGAGACGAVAVASALAGLSSHGHHVAVSCHVLVQPRIPVAVARVRANETEQRSIELRRWQEMVRRRRSHRCRLYRARWVLRL